MAKLRYTQRMAHGLKQYPSFNQEPDQMNIALVHANLFLLSKGTTVFTKKMVNKKKFETVFAIVADRIDFNSLFFLKF